MVLRWLIYILDGNHHHVRGGLQKINQMLELLERSNHIFFAGFVSDPTKSYTWHFSILIFPQQNMSSRFVPTVLHLREWNTSPSCHHFLPLRSSTTPTSGPKKHTHKDSHHKWKVHLGENHGKNTAKLQNYHHFTTTFEAKHRKYRVGSPSIPLGKRLPR